MFSKFLLVSGLLLVVVVVLLASGLSDRRSAGDRSACTNSEYRPAWQIVDTNFVLLLG